MACSTASVDLHTPSGPMSGTIPFKIIINDAQEYIVLQLMLLPCNSRASNDTNDLRQHRPAARYVHTRL
jgi:hypothetical protein